MWFLWDTERLARDWPYLRNYELLERLKRNAAKIIAGTYEENGNGL
jgi:hypothetical protein